MHFSHHTKFWDVLCSCVSTMYTFAVKMKDSGRFCMMTFLSFWCRQDERNRASTGNHCTVWCDTDFTTKLVTCFTGTCNISKYRAALLIFSHDAWQSNERFGKTALHSHYSGLVRCLPVCVTVAKSWRMCCSIVHVLQMCWSQFCVSWYNIQLYLWHIYISDTVKVITRNNFVMVFLEMCTLMRSIVCCRFLSLFCY
jgi:hypothetical protein